MLAETRSDLRGLLAGLLVLLIALTSVGRGGAAEQGRADLHAAIPGAGQPLCHAGREAPGPADPAQPADPDCCAACALLADAVLPVAPELSRPRSAPTPAARHVAAALQPEPSRIRSPRQAQAPPVA